MALVLTLIMLAIITVVTVVFLATARRNRQATATRLYQTDAEFAAEAAYQRALAEVMTNILGAMVSTNGSPVTNPAPSFLALDFLVSAPIGYGVYATNASFDSGTTNTRPYLQDVIPIVVDHSTNLDVYLDLNRNREFDDPRGTNGPYGDPIWIGGYDKPWLPEGPNNRALYRMAYVIQPVGKSLDLNTIHNRALGPSRDAGGQTGDPAYLRNQGFGPWELNLAAFLAELSPQVWWDNGNGYSYGPPLKPDAVGVAFEDARAIVDHRTAFGTQLSPLAGTYNDAAILDPLNAPLFPPRSIDAYSDGVDGTVLGANAFLFDDDTGPPAQPPITMKIMGTHWAGSEPTNNFFSIQDLFSGKVVNAPPANPNDFYDRFTNAMALDPGAYYRMIAQLGTQAGSDFDDRININYADKHAGESVTNFISWSTNSDYAVAFFTNVAQRIFLTQSNLFNPSTNGIPLRSMWSIPVYPTNLYSASIHRILQVAANIYDATQGDTNGPSVFRPIFGPGEMAGVNYIIGYTNDNYFGPEFERWLDSNTNGIPLVISARKGYPNFNELGVRTDVLITRKMQVAREAPVSGARLTDTNIMYILGVSNSLFVEAWNSYATRFRQPVTLEVSNFTVVTLTNDRGYQNTIIDSTNTSSDVSSWAGFRSDIPASTNSFVLALNTTNQIILTNSVYRFAENTFTNIGTNEFESTLDYPLLYSVLNASNRIAYRMYPQGSSPPNRRILDFVLLNSDQSVDLYKELLASETPYADVPGVPQYIVDQWNTNRTYGPLGPTDGMRYQLDVSLGNIVSSATDWIAFTPSASVQENDKQAAIDAFRNFMGLGALSTNTFSTNLSLAMQSPFNPAARVVVQTSWQANDPLVHYHPTDLLLWPTNQNRQYLNPGDPATNIWPATIQALNERYAPWGGNPAHDPVESGPDFDRSMKDPAIYSSDEWQFPTNKLASVGLLGRIHRGTPWQTIYLKSEIANPQAWIRENHDFRSHPTNDWRLVDLFTTAIDERTSRGLVSVNQTNIESWSALLSGVVVLSNVTEEPFLRVPRSYEPLFIEPNGGADVTTTPLGRIWKAIHDFQVFTNAGRPLQSAGDLLQIPELTVNSPYLNLIDPGQMQYGMDDFAYEKIPQQILSLLRVGQPRFVIYAYGQALRPADIDPSNGRVRNYQVTAEYATRTVVRVEGDPRQRVWAVVESFNVLPPD